MGALKFDGKTVLAKQLEICKQLYTGKARNLRLKAHYEQFVGVLSVAHDMPDSRIYVSDCGSVGFQAVRFYNDNLDVRFGGYHESQDQALSDALCNL